MSKEQMAKAAMRSAVRMQVKRGKIKKDNCFVCKSDKNIEQHHLDYSKPFWIMWLCRNCHKDVHRSESFKNILLKTALQGCA